MTCHKPMLESLQSQGVRLTAQRALILESLFHHRGHHTADDIYRDVAGRLPGLSRTTVYRTLEMLSNAHIIAAFQGLDGVTSYELVQGLGEPHHHLHCRQCGAELDLELEPVERLRQEILARAGFHADLDHLVIFGLCASCQAQAETDRGSQTVR